MGDEERKYNTMKELDLAMQGLEKKIDTLATADDMKALVDIVQEAMVAKAPAPAAQPAAPAAGNVEVGMMPEAAGNYTDLSQYDPTLHIEIHMVPSPGRLPKILQFPGKDADVKYAPKFDANGISHYYLPRRFGEAQLKNTSGMKWGLSWPNEITIMMRGERMRKEQRTFRADPTVPPIMVSTDGIPIGTVVPA